MVRPVASAAARRIGLPLSLRSNFPTTKASRGAPRAVATSSRLSPGGTARTLDPGVRDLIEARVIAIAEKVAEGLHEAGFDFNDDAIPFGIACFRSIVEHGMPL